MYRNMGDGTFADLTDSSNMMSLDGRGTKPCRCAPAAFEQFFDNRSGRVTGIEAPPPSHTTGHTVFRIRRLNPAALRSRRKIRWHHKPVAPQRCIR